MDEANDLDGFAVFYFSSQLESGLALPVSDPREVKAAIDGMAPSQLAGRLDICVEQLIAKRQETEFRQFDVVHLHVISDFTERDLGRCHVRVFRKQYLKLDVTLAVFGRDC